MRKPLHTPGPWTFGYNPYLLRSGDELPAFEIFGEEERICATNEDQPRKEQEANAMLIAAAPDMLEALRWQEMAEADPQAARRKGYFDRARALRKAVLVNVRGGLS